MGSNLQGNADLVTFTGKILMENFMFCEASDASDTETGKSSNNNDAFRTYLYI